MQVNHGAERYTAGASVPWLYQRERTTKRHFGNLADAFLHYRTFSYDL